MSMNRFNQRLLIVSLAGLLLLGFGPVAQAADRPVPGVYATIQTGINAAQSGDTVTVAAGLYTENITLENGVHVQGSGRDACTIQGNVSTTVIFANGLTLPTTISGFTIQGGGGYTVGWAGNQIMGGGVFADQSNLIIRDCRIKSNIAQIGGGIAVMNSTVTLADNEIILNAANRANAAAINMGGGLYLLDSSATVSGNTISNNLASSGPLNPSLVDPNGNRAPGGGVCLIFSKNVGAVLFMDNTIASNEATGSQYYGGGFYIYQDQPTFTNNIIVLGNIFTGNKGLDGGAIALVQSSPKIVNNVFTQNQAHWGGGIYGYRSGGRIDANSFIDNQAVKIRPELVGGGAILFEVWSTPTINANHFKGNTAVDYAGAIQAYDEGVSEVIAANTFVDNTAQFGGAVVVQLKAVADIQRNYFDGNQASMSGGALFAENTALFPVTNNLFINNDAAMFGGAVSAVNQGLPSLINNTMANNTCGWQGAGVHSLSSPIVVMNNIVVNNQNFGMNADAVASVTSYNDVWGNSPDNYFQLVTAGTGSISQDPLFVDTIAYQLQAASPAKNAGNPLPQYNDTDGTLNDMGAYGGPGAKAAGDLIPYLPHPDRPTVSVIPVGNQIILSWTRVEGMAGYQFLYAPQDFSTFGVIDMGALTYLPPFEWPAGVVFYVAVRAYDAGGNYGGFSNIATVALP